MCMYAKEVPRTKRDGLVVKCKKWLLRPEGGLFVTPILNYYVPTNGWLLPHRTPNDFGTPVYYNDKFHDGYIHAYEYDSDFRLLEFCGRNIYVSYAVSVLAFGSSSPVFQGIVSHLVCRALYIPRADTIGSRSKTVKLLKSAKSIKAIVKQFPHLKQALTGVK